MKYPEWLSPSSQTQTENFIMVSSSTKAITKIGFWDLLSEVFIFENRDYPIASGK